MLSVPLLAPSSNIVSCPKKGTSYQLLPSLSITSKICIISVSVISIVVNFSAVVNVDVVVLIFPDTALTFLVNRYSAG